MAALTKIVDILCDNTDCNEAWYNCDEDERALLELYCGDKL